MSASTSRRTPRSYSKRRAYECRPPGDPGAVGVRREGTGWRTLRTESWSPPTTSRLVAAFRTWGPSTSWRATCSFSSPSTRGRSSLSMQEWWELVEKLLSFRALRVLARRHWCAPSWKRARPTTQTSTHSWTAKAACIRTRGRSRCGHRMEQKSASLFTTQWPERGDPPCPSDLLS